MEKKMGVRQRRYKNINRKLNICLIVLELAVFKGREQIRRL